MIEQAFLEELEKIAARLGPAKIPGFRIPKVKVRPVVARVPRGKYTSKFRANVRARVRRGGHIRRMKMR